MATGSEKEGVISHYWFGHRGRIGVSAIRRAFEARWTGPINAGLVHVESMANRSDWRHIRHDGQGTHASPFDGLAVLTLPPMDYRTGGYSLEPGGFRVLCLAPWTHHTTASTADGI